ncbi:PTS sugar transporter subunit IIA [Caldovatus aquaticus]|uniref:PTS sugar transporter subunit IIA n=1 Tax=Caldovatus aquaticus TaxID=2865671 RepID=UPI0038D05F92
MIGLVLVTHGRLAEELRHAMEHVVGPQRGVATVCIGPEDDIEGRRADIRECIRAVDEGDGVVVLTDILGGTPSNLAMSLLDQREDVEVIAGVNLPLLVKLAKVRGTEPLAEAVDRAQAAGRKYIASGSEMLNGHGPVAGPRRRQAPLPAGPEPAPAVPADAREAVPAHPAPDAAPHP